MEAFEQSRVLLKVALVPQNCQSPIDAIKKQLNSMLLKYIDDMKGVPITFSDIGFPPGKEYGRILGEQPWIHVDVHTTMLMFKPCVGLILKGRISKISESHTSLLVLGILNASISSDDMSTKYIFNDSNCSWESAQGNLVEGDLMECKVVNFQHANGVLSLVCTLV